MASQRSQAPRNLRKIIFELNIILKIRPYSAKSAKIKTRMVLPGKQDKAAIRLFLLLIYNNSAVAGASAR